MKNPEKPIGYIPLEMSLMDAKIASEALCDVLCWLDGFKAAGGTYSPGTIEVLRVLSCKLKDTLP
jgi:hypothetical protein